MDNDARKDLEPIRAEVFTDRPADPDKLSFQFGELAASLADYALGSKNRTPFSIVVKGSWGRGKTTLLRATQAHLNKVRGEAKKSKDRKQADSNVSQRVPFTVYFNVWKYPDEETVLAGLLGALLDAMRRDGADVEAKVALEGRKGALIKGLLAIAAPWVDLEGLEETKFTASEAKRAFHDRFRSLFGQLWYLWSNDVAIVQDLDARDVEENLRSLEEQQVLAVFLDDLDRCTEQRVYQTLQAINLFMDLPGVCFYLGLDWDRTVEILQKTLGDEKRAVKYLEKIVQIEFALPEIDDYLARDYTTSLLDGTELGTLLSRQTTGGAKPLDDFAEVLSSNHPRHVKRVLNDLSIKLSALSRTKHLAPSDAARDQDDRLHLEDVIAWHLVLEAATPEQKRDLHSRANLLGLVNTWREHRKTLGAATDAEAAPARDAGGIWADLFARKVLRPYLDVLAELGAARERRLVNFGSPVREEPADRDSRSGKRSVSGRGVAASAVAVGRAEADWVSIPAGTFSMGESGIAEPVHEVSLRPFLIARYPVTNEEYQRFVDDAQHPAPWGDGGFPEEKARHPVVDVAWTDAVAYAKWLQKQLKGEVDLPTEAQWEYAARGAEGRIYPWGSDEPNERLANFGVQVGGTTPVGSFPAGATPEGVHDLAGNVWEWCQDWHGDYGRTPDKDPKGPQRGRLRVLRGGSWYNDASNLRAAYRFFNHPEFRGGNVGFRVVWLPPEDNN